MLIRIDQGVKAKECAARAKLVCLLIIRSLWLR